MERRRLTKEDIDKVRDIEGFPIGSDEDIIALSDAPLYTACPNPFIEDFIKEYGTPYDEETDDYHREPFAADVSEGKNDPIYNAHSYHTKVPYRAICKYIKHYTNPKDVVLDGFCGTGMTGVAAQLCDIENEWSSLKTTSRNALLCDLSTAATYIAYNYTRANDQKAFWEDSTEIFRECYEELGWMYKTKHTAGPVLPGVDVYGDIVYTVWSDVFICSNCGEELVFWDCAVDSHSGKIKDDFKCPKCGMSVNKRNLHRAKEYVYDGLLESMTEIAKQVPVKINYVYGGKRYDKTPDNEDIELIDKIARMDYPYWVPIEKMPVGFNTEQPKKSHGVEYVHQFYTKRNLIVYSAFISKARNNTEYLFALSAFNIHVNRMRRYQPVKPGGTPGLPGTLFISSVNVELSIFDGLPRKVRDIGKAFHPTEGNVIVSTQSATCLSNIPDNSIDYIFTDPPFGGNLNYSELNYLWESWLKVKTNNDQEAIMNPIQGKGLVDYQSLMERCFREYNRVLKPNRWMTVEFHNSKNSVWNAIQEALLRAGFIIADVRMLDKKQGSFKQVTTSSAVKQDLVISAYKPKESFVRSFLQAAGTENTAWEFVKTHLDNLPIVVDADNNGKIDILTERQAFFLYDRMIAYHIMQGVSIPIDATDFYKGLDEHFLKRDNMYFLPDQVNEYDLARASADVEEVQLAYLVIDEKSAIQWLYNELKEPKTYQDIMPEFMKAMQALDKHEKMPELAEILEENFLKDSDEKWYIPDLTKSGDIAKLREKNLLKEFQEYLESKGKLKVFRSEAVRVGFAKLWKDKDYKSIVSVAERLPEKIIQEDPNLLMYYDISLSRV